METDQSQLISEIIQTTEDKSKVEMLLEEPNPIGNPSALLDVIEASTDKYEKKLSRKEKKHQNRKQEKEKQFFSKLAKEEKDRLNRLRKCEERQKNNKDRNERYTLASRNLGDSGVVSGPVICSVAPQSPPMCKDCGKKHW